MFAVNTWKVIQGIGMLCELYYFPQRAAIKR
jgi:hypothetical protein